MKCVRGLVTMTVAIATGFSVQGCSDDILESSERTDLSVHGVDMYIGDVGDDAVERFDAETGAYLGPFVTPQSGGLFGPRGLVFSTAGNLLVVNQNVNQPYAGEVLEYQGGNGTFERALVSRDDDHAPYAPRGIVRAGGMVYVADMGEPGYTMAGLPAPNPFPARVSVFNELTGVWDRDLSFAGFDQTCTPEGVCTQLSPRGLAFGPDGALYVSVMKFISDADPNATAGLVLRFGNGGADPGTVFIDGETCNCGLARPEGLAFGSDSRLYVTSFRTSALDTDKILVFCIDSSFKDQIDLYAVGEPQSYAQALAFGPQGLLYVPISGDSADTGSVRRYDVTTKSYDVVVPAGGALQAGWYITFGARAPASHGGHHAHDVYERSTVGLAHE